MISATEGPRPMVGGQAVIEGVMMRAPGWVATAVRTPGGAITVKREPFRSISDRVKILKAPILRGAVVLVESLWLGFRSLSYSAEKALEEEEREKGGDEAGGKKKRGTKKKSGGGGGLGHSLWMGLILVAALVGGLLLFFYLPLVITDRLGLQGSIGFNLVDGAFRLIIFLLYLYLITRWKEMKRLFQYHGAEHKSIFAMEKGKPLTIEGARPFSTHHPRCGTSFLLVVMLVSIVVFIFMGKPHGVEQRLLRLGMVPIIGGISYELIRLSSREAAWRYVRPFLAPGVALQRLTTGEPDDQMLEVALVALRASLGESEEDLRGKPLPDPALEPTIPPSSA